LYFYQQHMAGIREAIEQGRLEQFADQFYAEQERGV
jgi:queuine tRNA-ribosyltransferase